MLGCGSNFLLLLVTDVCNDPRDVGPCKGYFVKAYYDTAQGRCLEFAYGGCDGNGNRFSSIEECESVCFKKEEVQPPGNDTSIAHTGKYFNIRKACFILQCLEYDKINIKQKHCNIIQH